MKTGSVRFGMKLRQSKLVINGGVKTDMKNTEPINQ